MGFASNMKKFLILFFILCSFSAFAQEQNQYVKKFHLGLLVSVGLDIFQQLQTILLMIILVMVAVLV